VLTDERTFVVKDSVTPITHYPKRKLGKIEIGKRRVRKSDIFWAEGVRGKLFYRHEKGATITTLKIDGQVWMTDDWTYTESLASFAERAKGQVLVAGLGLGIVVHQLVKNPEVTEIKVIELNPNVIRLVRPLLPKDNRIQIIEDDFNRFTDECSLQDGYVPDTIIWDLAVRSDDTHINDHQMAFMNLIIGAKFSDFWIKKGEWVPRTNYKGHPQIFVHGIDRDPEGSKFVKTEKFRQAHKLMVR